MTTSRQLKLGVRMPILSQRSFSHHTSRATTSGCTSTVVVIACGCSCWEVVVASTVAWSWRKKQGFSHGTDDVARTLLA